MVLFEHTEAHTFDTSNLLGSSDLDRSRLAIPLITILCNPRIFAYQVIFAYLELYLRAFFQEWLWLTGFFLRAQLKVAKARGAHLDETLKVISTQLARAGEHLDQSPWRGLTELTNRNGEFCPFSSPTQAWSFATLLELLYETEVLV